MIVYPAIDLQNGKCVRLCQGEFDRQTVYGEDPVAVALRWQNEGAKWLHLVDLDGAKEGERCNEAVIASIVKALDIPVQLGGGIRNRETVERYHSLGIRRMILGTAALEQPDFVACMAQEYPGEIAVGIDAKNGKVAVRGWLEVSDTSAFALAKQVREMGITTLIYTDIATDGMLCGPNLTELRMMCEQSGMEVIASGGIAKPEDVQQVKACGAAGVIIGKALYHGSVSLGEALTLAEGVEETWKA